MLQCSALPPPGRPGPRPDLPPGRDQQDHGVGRGQPEDGGQPGQVQDGSVQPGLRGRVLLQRVEQHEQPGPRVTRDVRDVT